MLLLRNTFQPNKNTQPIYRLISLFYYNAKFMHKIIFGFGPICFTIISTY